MPLAAFISVSRRGDLRVAVSPALHKVKATMLSLIIVFFLGMTVNFTVYRHRTIQGRRRGRFGLAEMSHSPPFASRHLAGPAACHKDSIHGRGRGLFDVVEWLSSHAPCASRVKPLHSFCKGARGSGLVDLTPQPGKRPELRHSG